MAGGDRAATLDECTEQGRSDASQCAAMFEQFCVDAPAATRWKPTFWLSVHHEHVVPTRLQKLRQSGATDEQVSAYAESLEANLWRELSRFHNVVGPIERFRP